MRFALSFFFIIKKRIAEKMIVLRIAFIILSDKLRLLSVVKKRFIMIFTRRKIIKNKAAEMNNLKIGFCFILMV
jgi:hypothetical protein